MVMVFCFGLSFFFYKVKCNHGILAHSLARDLWKERERERITATVYVQTMVNSFFMNLSGMLCMYSDCLHLSSRIKGRDTKQG